MSQVDASITVCTHNRAAMLRQALQSLIDLQVDDELTYEIVVVDNASQDDTRQVVDAIIAKADVPVRYVYEPQKGFTYARNRALAESRGEWIASFDDDQIAAPDWLHELMAVATTKNCRSVGGAIEVLLPAGRISPYLERVFGATTDGNEPRHYGRNEWPGTGNQLLHRSVYEEVGGFDEIFNGRGEDTDLYRRIHAANIDTWFAPSARVQHIIPEERLEDSYLRRMCLQNGWAFCERDRIERGYPYVTTWALVRGTHALLVRSSHWLSARVRGDHDAALGARCGMWQTQGYVLGWLGRDPSAAETGATHA
jgi:glycosyltransferase involved in cell wall biosynthesis